MRTYDWDEYYEKFYDWSNSTRIKNLSYLTSFGDTDEVAEVVMEFSDNIPIANRVLRKIIDAKLKFSGEHILEFFFYFDKELVTQIFINSASILTAEDMEDLVCEVDDELIIKLCKEYKIHIPEILKEATSESDFSKEDIKAERPKKMGFLGTLFALIGASSGIDDPIIKSKNHNSKCNGDCANCPPHYGYRYGRWYYGHGHNYGCEFGGNKGGETSD